ncbi:hypothetical protein HanIR_Chr15g0759681 [Helianthus annuus]|nr:hypothetical protein HanIR_Chr15g0759681 [Helianthus annuus]
MCEILTMLKHKVGDCLRYRHPHFHTLSESPIYSKFPQSNPRISNFAIITFAFPPPRSTFTYLRHQPSTFSFILPPLIFYTFPPPPLYFYTLPFPRPPPQRFSATTPLLLYFPFLPYYFHFPSNFRLCVFIPCNVTPF